MISLSLKVRGAARDFYVPQNPGLARRTIQKLSHQWNRWERLTSDPPISRISRQTFAEFRAAGLEANLSPVTIEGVISDVRTVLKHCVDCDIISSVPSPGRRLRRIERVKATPSIEDLSRMIARASVAQWPRRHLVTAEDWWRCCLGAAFFTALRRHDLLKRPIADFRGESFAITQSKTGRIVRIPNHDTLRKLAKKMPLETLGGLGSAKQLRRELKRICEAAGVGPFTLQSIRRCSARAWEQARPGCGPLILGHAIKGAARYYLDSGAMLADAIMRLDFPHALGKPKILRDEPRLLKAFRRLDSREAAKAVRLLESLGD